MTRDKAIALVDGVYGKPARIKTISDGAMQSAAAAGLVDALLELGILHVDEPVTIEQEACGTLNRSIGCIEASIAMNALQSAGFKIVRA